jgi:hypothetical protein
LHDFVQVLEHFGDGLRIDGDVVGDLGSESQRMAAAR